GALGLCSAHPRRARRARAAPARHRSPGSPRSHPAEPDRRSQRPHPMTTTALVQRRDHLQENRRLIISRSLAAAASGAVPVPLLAEWLASAIRRRMIARVADSHGVDVEGGATAVLADGTKRSPAWTEVAGATLASKLLRRTWRKLLLVVVAASRA